MQQNLKNAANEPETLEADQIALEAEDAAERVVQIEMLIVSLREAGSLQSLSIERTESAGRDWTPALADVPTDEIARRDAGSIYAELTRREKYTAGAVAELWAARQGNAARAQVERDKAQAREDEFARPVAVGPGHAALMAIGAALGYRAPEVTA